MGIPVVLPPIRELWAWTGSAAGNIVISTIRGSRPNAISKTLPCLAIV
jgi:hypothetical protein